MQPRRRLPAKRAGSLRVSGCNSRPARCDWGWRLRAPSSCPAVASHCQSQSRRGRSAAGPAPAGMEREGGLAWGWTTGSGWEPPEIISSKTPWPLFLPSSHPSPSTNQHPALPLDSGRARVHPPLGRLFPSPWPGPCAADFLAGPAAPPRPSLGGLSSRLGKLEGSELTHLIDNLPLVGKYRRESFLFEERAGELGGNKMRALVYRAEEVIKHVVWLDEARKGCDLREIAADNLISSITELS